MILYILYTLSMYNTTYCFLYCTRDHLRHYNTIYYRWLRCIVSPIKKNLNSFVVCTRPKFVADGGDCFMVERASTTVSSTTSSAWAPGHAWSQYCSPSAGSTLAALMPSALHRGPLRISPVKSEPYDMAADIPPSISKSKFHNYRN